MKGFTLIELVVYAGILAIILVLIFNFSWQIIYGEIKSQTLLETQQNARFAMEKITRNIEKASAINSPAPGSSSNTLSLKMPETNLDPTVFEIFNDKLRIIEGTNTPLELTSDRVLVKNLQFTNLSYQNTPGTIRIEITIDHKNPTGQNPYSASFALESSVSLLMAVVSAPPVSCWGTGGACDSSCQYSNYGSLVNSFSASPGCSASCPASGSFYVNPSGICSSDGTGSCYKMESPATAYTSCAQSSACQTCWAISGVCDSACLYRGYGTITNYYNNPGCSSSCPVSGTFYRSPSGTCRTNGTGSCYKMVSPVSVYTSCAKGTACVGSCAGTCRACSAFTSRSSCIGQSGCSWNQQTKTCSGTCAPCNSFSGQSACAAQTGCSWTSTAWNWTQGNLQNGYSFYNTCLWGSARWNWNLSNSLSGFSSYTTCQWIAQ